MSRTSRENPQTGPGAPLPLAHMPGRTVYRKAPSRKPLNHVPPGPTYWNGTSLIHLSLFPSLWRPVEIYVFPFFTAFFMATFRLAGFKVQKEVPLNTKFRALIDRSLFRAKKCHFPRSSANSFTPALPSKTGQGQDASFIK